MRDSLREKTCKHFDNVIHYSTNKRLKSQDPELGEIMSKLLENNQGESTGL
jgi:hypothetical protein